LYWVDEAMDDSSHLISVTPRVICASDTVNRHSEVHTHRAAQGQPKDDPYMGITPHRNTLEVNLR